MLLPELLDKLKVVEEKKPVFNVSSNIMRIRELISQARSVAKKVSVHLTSSSLTFYCVCVCEILYLLHIEYQNQHSTNKDILVGLTTQK